MTTLKSPLVSPNARVITRSILCAITLLTLGLVTAQSQTAIANFTDGTFGSAADDGWANGWVKVGNKNTSSTRNVISTNPLNNGGNYLKTVFTINATSSETPTPPADGTIRYGGTARQIDTTAIDLTQGTFDISFDFRCDGGDASSRPSIFQDILVGGSAPVVAGNSTTWQLYTKNGYWYVTHSNAAKNGNAETQLLAYTQGSTYHFNLSLNADTSTYGITATSSAANEGTATLQDLGFRYNTKSGEQGTTIAGSFLVFTMGGGTSTTTPSDHTFSIDSISVATQTAPVPEPAHFAFLAGLALLGIVFGARHCRR